ncbi:MAG: CRISPR system precrRNA processing endoribonuclease RAMP protein Cas6 [Acidobacteria bacterium]|nr:CRISPR system precrRNA processing endoribonuclease RAMP protein Cas6 [Acidobacteriota bacterium]
MAPELQVFHVYLHNLHGPLPIAAVRAHALNGLFHTEMGKHHPAVVDDLHRTNGPAPFSLTPLFDEEQFLGFRVGALTADFGQHVAEVWGGLAAQRAEVQLGSAQLWVQEVKPGRPRATSYEQLLAEAPVAHGLRLRFETPVRLKTFGQSGVLPTPHAVWQFYAQRWEKHAGSSLPPEFVRWTGARVQATELALETRYAYIEKTVEWKGVMGEVEYLAFTDDDRDVPASRIPDYLRAWQALALLAEFCGTGEKATMGMGRTRRVKTFGLHKEKGEI